MTKLYNKMLNEYKNDPDFIIKAAYIHICLNYIFLAVMFLYLICLGLRYLYPSTFFIKTFDIAGWVFISLVIVLNIVEYILKIYCKHKYKKFDEDNRIIDDAVKEYIKQKKHIKDVIKLD